MGSPTIIKSYVIDGKDLDYEYIRKHVPAYVSDSTLQNRLKRGVRNWAALRQHPKDTLSRNGRRNGTKFNQTWKAQKQAQIERASRTKQQKEEHGW